MKPCGCKTEVYSRVVGYYRPVAQWNKGKKQEFSDRKFYTAGSRFEESLTTSSSATYAQPVAAAV